MHAVIVEDLLFTRRESEHHSHDVEAEGARVVLGALVFEGGRLAAIVDHEAGAAVEGLDLLREAKAAEALCALDAVVHLVEDEGARAGTLDVHIGRLLGRQTEHV